MASLHAGQLAPLFLKDYHSGPKYFLPRARCTWAFHSSELNAGALRNVGCGREVPWLVPRLGWPVLKQKTSLRCTLQEGDRLQAEERDLHSRQEGDADDGLTEDDEQEGSDQTDSEAREPWTPEKEYVRRKFIVDFGKFTSERWIPLHTAAATGQTTSLEWLVQQGADPNVLDRDGYTPLHKAVMNRRELSVKALLRLGANACVVDQEGCSLLHYAAQTGSVPIIRLLVKYNCDVNAADNDSWTPLHVAAQTGNYDVVRALLLYGASPKKANKNGNTPYDIVKAYGYAYGFSDAQELLARPPKWKKLVTGQA